jgi:transposase
MISALEAGLEGDDTSYETPTSALREPVGVVMRPERRRNWHPQQKLAIVQESCTADAVPTQIARRYGISTGLLYTWRKQLLSAATGGFIPCEIVPDAMPVAPPALPMPDNAPAVPPAFTGSIEVALPSGTTLRIAGAVDPTMLRLVLDALARS